MIAGESCSLHVKSIPNGPQITIHMSDDTMILIGGLQENWPLGRQWLNNSVDKAYKSRDDIQSNDN